MANMSFGDLMLIAIGVGLLVSSVWGMRHVILREMERDRGEGGDQR